MSFQIAISVLFLISIIGVGIWFYKGRQTLEHLHKQTIYQLEDAIERNRNQIGFRKSNLNLYDFQKYNLVEALIIQPEITI